MNKENRQRFYRVSEARMNKIIHMIRLLGNCSKTNIYEYNDDQVERIFQNIYSELEKAKDQFKMRNKYRASKFSLKDVEYMEVPLPDGSKIVATAINDVNFPAININLLDGDKEPEQVCFVEFNPERGESHELSIGVYNSEVDGTVYYESYHPVEVEE